jgi:nitroreductase
VIVRHPRATGAYYLVKGSYLRDQQSMLAGILRYHADSASGSPIFRLIRNIHKLEKGLIHPGRRSVFARRYITETIDAYERIRTGGSADQHVDLLTWTAHVLARYFDVVGPDAIVDSARARFVAVDESTAGRFRAPVPVDTSEPAVTFDQLLGLSLQRRSVRSFLPDRLDRDALDRALSIAQQAPSACNRQAFQFRVLDDPLLVEQVLDLAPGFQVESPVPCVIVVVGRYRGYFRERDMHVIYIDASLATMSLLFGLQTQGIASCCINWPSNALLDAAIADVLDLDQDEEVVMLVAAGRPLPAALVPYSQKAPLDRLRRYNAG